MNRRHNFQTVSWFYDLFTRTLLDMDPPYQRRSVWNQAFKDYFVDTVLLNLPAPAVFLYEEIAPDGRSLYHVVDGKQRLSCLFEFIKNGFPVGEKSESSALRGLYFSELDDDAKKSFWGYQFLIEYVPSSDEKLINAIFDRINRNVAKLSSQELRHAKLDGEFIGTAEDLAEWMTGTLPKNFPRLVQQSRNQMKDVELVAQLLLLLEEGPRGYSQEELDAAFTSRDNVWEHRQGVEDRFRATVAKLNEIIGHRELAGTRLRNQADFYSLFGAIDAHMQAATLPAADVAAERLAVFLERLESDTERDRDSSLASYYEATRVASNLKAPRETRVRVLRNVLAGV